MDKTEIIVAALLIMGLGVMYLVSKWDNRNPRKKE